MTEIMMTNILSLIVLTAFSLAFALADDPNCSLPGQCAESDYISHFGCEDERECLDSCKDTIECAWYTFDSDDNICFMWKNCQNLTEANCPSCISGAVGCNLYDCSLPGTCQGTVDHAQQAASEGSCARLCRGDGDCTWYTYDTEASLCLLFQTCPSIDEETCQNCRSGERGCKFSDGFTKLLVTTGHAGSSSEATVSEIIDLEDASNKCEHYFPFPNPDGVVGAAYGLLEGKTPFVCGGEVDFPLSTRNCYVLGKDDVQAEMQIKRKYPASIVIKQQTTLWVTGGDGSQGPQDTSEYVQPGQDPIFGPTLPKEMHMHCMIKLNDSLVFFIGGYNGDHVVSDRTDIFNLDTKKWSRGPSLLINRYIHTCGKVKDQETNDDILIVTGGRGLSEGLKSTEILVSSRLEDGWQWGPDLPKAITSMAGVESFDSSALFLVGAPAEGNDYGSLIYKMTCKNEVCSMETMDQKLSVPRGSPLAMLVPDSMTNCTYN